MPRLSVLEEDGPSGFQSSRSAPEPLLSIDTRSTFFHLLHRLDRDTLPGHLTRGHSSVNCTCACTMDFEHRWMVGVTVARAARNLQVRVA
jgi:hypothetical protein